ncbi:MAG TPA: YIP1 family protein, partial [Blastocatellia bacterium]|nr:YIP1 family protein [Blastocatellia bacterium]
MTPETNYASPTTPTTATDIAPKSFFSRLMGVYFSPGETFKEIGLNPSFIVALLILMLVGGLASYLMIDRITVPKFFSPGFEQAVADGRMQQEQMNQQLEGMNKYALWIKVGFFVVGFIQWAIIPLAVAGLFKLISMLLGTENKFKSVFTVTIYALLAVTILSTVVFLSTLYLKPVDEIDMNNLGASNLGALLTMLLGK